MTFRV